MAISYTSTFLLPMGKSYEKCAKRQPYPFDHTFLPNYGNFSRKLHFEWVSTLVTLLIQPLWVQGLSCCYFHSQTIRRWWQWRAEECDSPPRRLSGPAVGDPDPTVACENYIYTSYSIIILLYFILYCSKQGIHRLSHMNTHSQVRSYIRNGKNVYSVAT